MNCSLEPPRDCESNYLKPVPNTAPATHVYSITHHQELLPQLDGNVDDTSSSGEEEAQGLSRPRLKELPQAKWEVSVL